MSAKSISRRSFLRAAGVAMGLPMLDAMSPIGLRSRADAPATPRRMVVMGQPLGLHTPYLFPEQSGRNYEPTPYLRLFGDLRNDLTVFSGLSHPEYKPGHDSEIALLTGAPWDSIKNPRDIRNTVSVDQVAAELVGRQTRFPYLVLASWMLSWNRRGVRLPCDGNAASVFSKLFIDGRPDEVRTVVRNLNDGRSILDMVRDDARRLQNRVGPADRDRLDQYFASIREAEVRLAQDEAWASRPKPRVKNVAPPVSIQNDDYLLEKTRQWYDVIHLALQTDSTRVISLFLGGGGALMLPSGRRSQHYHDLSHHGQEDRKIEQLAEIEREQMRLLAEFIGKLKATREEGGTLLDRTSVFFGSNLSNANAHSNVNLPILLAGGGFRHGQHVAFDRTNNRPLCNLYLTMLQRFGVETDRFGTSTGTIGEIG